MFLKKHQPQTYFAVNPKKSTLRSLMSSLQLYCSCTEQITQISLELSKFSRHPGELFSESISKFDSLFTFLQMLRQPIKKDQLSILTKEVVQGIAPYLMEQKCAKVFGSWLQESILLKRDTSKQQIIETVHKLEMNPALKLTSTKTIPAHFAQTQLGLQEITHPDSAQAFVVQPVDLPRPPPRRASGNRTPGPAGRSSPHGSSYSRAGSQAPRPPSAGSQQRSRRDQFLDQRSVGPAKQEVQPRQQSGSRQPSGPRQPSNSRLPSGSRSTSQHSYKSAYSQGSRNNSGSASGRSLDSPHRALEKHTIYSKSSKRDETVRLPSQFRRDLTPKTRRFLDDTYFIKHKNSERFKNVMKDKKCMRCAGAHFGNECKIYRYPCTILCRACVYLYHPTNECIHFNLDGTIKKPHQKN